ncbi:MAG: hypothetical protein KKF44_06810, partial [Nanoarchaeota archaeon]|nr:hypothetical protein [Nanoarchaeota archaeon]
MLGKGKFAEQLETRYETTTDGIYWLASLIEKYDPLGLILLNPGIAETISARAFYNSINASLLYFHPHEPHGANEDFDKILSELSGMILSREKTTLDGILEKDLFLDAESIEGFHTAKWKLGIQVVWSQGLIPFFVSEEKNH